MKYVANLLVAINNVASAEAMVLGMKAGLPPQVIFDLIKGGAGNSRIFELRAPMMVKGDYKDATMKIDVWDKDMRVIGDYARKIKVPTPMFDASKPIYIKAQQSGFGAQDTAVVCAVLEKMAKVKRGKPSASSTRPHLGNAFVFTLASGLRFCSLPPNKKRLGGRPWRRYSSERKSVTACGSTGTCRSPWTTAWCCAPMFFAR